MQKIKQEKMKKLLLTFLSVFVATIAMQAQTIFYSESFEDSIGWSLSHQFDDGFEDYAIWDSVAKINARGSGPDYNIEGADSNFILAFEDINSGDPGSAAAAGSVVLSIDSISIVGYDSLKLMMAASCNPTNNRYDNAKNWFGSNGNGDTVSVWAKIDNGVFVKVMQFCAPDSNAGKTSSSNTGPLHFDENMNYIGGDNGEVALDDTLSTFMSNISGMGTFLSIRVEIRVESGDEEFSMDNVRVQGVKSTTCNDPSKMVASQLSTTSYTLGWNSISSLSNIEYGAMGYTQGSGTMINNVTSPYVFFSSKM